MDNGTKSDKDWTMMLIVSIFLGNLGIHRFIAGKAGSGVAMLLTLGGCGIWTIIDIISIATGKFTDGQGKLITKN